MADQAPQPEPSTHERISQWLALDGTPGDDVSRETSPGQDDEAEAEVTDGESDSDAGANAQVEGADSDEGIKTFAELAKSFEVDEETLAKSLRVTGRDGKEVALHEVLTAYRAPAPEAAEVERSRARLVELEGKEADVSRAADELRRTAQALAAQLKAREPDWATLKQTDPAGYTVARLEWLEHQQQLERASQQYQARRAQEQAENDQRLHAFRVEQAQRLQAARPEWKDRAVFEREIGATERDMIARGYKPEEIAQVADHRDWLVADDARRWRELQAKKPAVAQKLKNAPRLMAPGASSGADRGASARTAQAESELMARLRTTGRPEDAAALISGRIEASERTAAARKLASGRRS